MNYTASAAVPPQTKKQFELYQQQQRFGQHGLHYRSNRRVLANQISKVYKVTAALPTLSTPLGQPKQPVRQDPCDQISTTEVMRSPSFLREILGLLGSVLFLFSSVALSILLI